MRRFLSLLLIGGFMLAAVAVFAPPLRAAAPKPGDVAALATFVIASPIAGLPWVICIAALSALITLVKPERVQREASVVNTHRSTCFWWGLPTGLLLLMLMGNERLAWIVIPLTSLVIAVGFAGIGYAVGHRLLSKTHTFPPTVVAAIGSAVLGLAFLVPFAGWVLFLYVACLSLGAFRLTWFGKLAEQMFFPDDIK